MLYIKSFDQLNESKSSDLVSKLLTKFSKLDVNKLKNILEPYKDTIEKYYNKYSKNNVVDIQLIHNDLKKFSFNTNERNSWDDEDFGDNESNNLVLRILYKIFVRFPKSVVTGIWGFFKETVIEAFQDGEYFLGMLMSVVWTIAAILAFAISVFTYQFVDHTFNGLETGKITSELIFTPEHIQPIVHTVSNGKTSYTYTTYINVPDTWTAQVTGDNGRVEDWSTTNSKLANYVKVGDKINNDNNWTWSFTEKK